MLKNTENVSKTDITVHREYNHSNNSKDVGRWAEETVYDMERKRDKREAAEAVT